MKAPEKIYIDVSLDSAWGMSKRSYDNEVEYTRTDAFIEKACEFISRRVFNCAEGNILEDFKKYMEE